jgi:8-amino-7-oxononanoate synthase
MSSLRKSIRQKRYKIKPDHETLLHIQTKFGDTIKLNVVECSNTGIRAHTAPTDDPSTPEWAEADMIVANAKMTWDNQEVSLGRLVLRRVDPSANGIEMAFSTIDVAVPTSGQLSKALDVDFDRSDMIDEKELNADRFSLAHFVENEYSNVDLFDRVREFAFFYREWSQSKKYAYQMVRTKSKGQRITLDRTRKLGRNDYLMLGSNDYLGLGAHPDVIAAATATLADYGFGSTGSPMTTGLTDLHTQLSDQVAKLHNKEAALLFNSGYAANIGIISALCTNSDLIIADQLCHASIQDAMNLSKGTSRFFKHNNPEHLETILQKERANFNGCLVITEGVFSMDGDVAKLDQIYAIARKYNARVMVDEAHCFGVIGQNGLGVCEKFGLFKEIDIIMGTFSKVGGGIGGFVTGSKDLIEWLRHFARSQIFSVSLPPSNIAAVSKALEIFSTNKQLVVNLKKNIQHFASGLRALGFDLPQDHESAVIPAVIGDEGLMGDIHQSLLDDGIWCVPIVYPAVGRKNCRFRFTMMATHTVSDLDYALTCFEKALLKVNFSPKGRLSSSKVAS